MPRAPRWPRRRCVRRWAADAPCWRARIRRARSRSWVSRSSRCGAAGWSPRNPRRRGRAPRLRHRRGNFHEAREIPDTGRRGIGATMMAPFVAVLRKDLLLEVRGGQSTVALGALSLLVLVVLVFAFNPGAGEQGAEAAAGA